MNQVALIGRLGQDPEVRFTAAGKAVCGFSLAVSEGKDDTVWLRCNAWEKTAEIMGQYCKKGQQVGVVGRLTERKWTDNDGKEKRQIEVVVSRLDLLGSRDDSEPRQSPQQRQQSQRQQQYQRLERAAEIAAQLGEYDDIPF